MLNSAELGLVRREMRGRTIQAECQASVRAYAEKKADNVVSSAVGTSFDSVEEGYEFYNLYSWETGFGVWYAKSRLNVHQIKCMQEIMCACAGKPLQSIRCGCTAMMMRLLRSDNNGCYVCKHRYKHLGPGETTKGKQYKHKQNICRHIDRYTWALVTCLSDNTRRCSSTGIQSRVIRRGGQNW